MKLFKYLIVGLLCVQLSGLPLLAAQTPLIQPNVNNPFGNQLQVSGFTNLRVAGQNAEGTEASLIVEYTYDGTGGISAVIIPIIGKKGQPGIGHWFGADPVTIGRGRGTVTVKVRYFNDEPGVPPAFTTDQVRMVLLNSTMSSMLSATPFLKTIKWGNPNAKPAPEAPGPLAAANPQQIQKLAEEKRLADEKARKEAAAWEAARDKAEAEAKARKEAEARVIAEARTREEARQKAEAEAKRLAEEKRVAEEKQIADAKAADQARLKAEQEERARKEAEAKALAEAKARDDARLKAEAETKRLAEEKRKADELAKAEQQAKEKARLAAEAKARETARLQAEAETKRLADERRIAEENAGQQALAREQARKKAEQEELVRKGVEAKALAEAKTREEARQKAEAEAKRLAEEKRVAEQKALAEAKARKEAEDKAYKEALAQAKAEFEAKRIAEEKTRAQQLAGGAATVTPALTQGVVQSLEVAPGLKTKITNVDVVNRSLDRSQMTIGVEFEYKDSLPDPLLGVDVTRQGEPAISSYFSSPPTELGRSRRNFVLFPVKFQPPAGLTDSAGFNTDKVLVYLTEKSTAKKYNIFPATMLLTWRAPGVHAAAPVKNSAANAVEIDDFKQNDPSSGYVSIKYTLLNPSARLRVKVYDSTNPKNAAYFSINPLDIKSGRSLQVIDVKIEPDSKSPSEIIRADTILVEMVDSAQNVLAKVSRETPMVWAKPR
jgi:hypothetical protein